jgi:PA14 domain
MKRLSVLIAALALSACDGGGSGPQGLQGPQGPAAPVPVVTPTQQLIDSIVAENNAWREAQGQTELSSGLTCSVQAVASGQWLSSASPGYNAAQGVLVLSGPSYAYLLTVGFNQANSGPGPNSVIDPAIQGLFLTNNYKINCSGYVVVTEDGYHSFTLSSDDGAILTVDGTQVINNDGSHGITTLNGTKALQSAVIHSINVQYAQSGAGNFALILQMDGSVLPAANLYH